MFFWFFFLFVFFVYIYNYWIFLDFGHVLDLSPQLFTVCFPLLVYANYGGLID